MADSRDKPEIETLSYEPKESCPIKKPLKDGQQPICGDKCEQPNQNLMIIEEIEGLMSQVNEKIYALTTLSGDGRITVKRTKLKGKVLEEIDLFQKTTLFDLRKANE